MHKAQVRSLALARLIDVILSERASDHGTPRVSARRIPR
jgi:hypothetical protein